MTVGHWWAAAAAAAPDHPVLWSLPDDPLLTRRDADELIRRFGAWYRGQGLRPGDRVLVDCGGGMLAIPAIFGAMATGLVAVCLPGDAPATLRHEARRSTKLALERGDGGVQLDGDDLVAALAAVDPVGELWGGDVEADAAILFSSGTTGTARGCRISHRALHHAIRAYPDLRPWQPEARVLVAAGLHTITGLRFVLPVPALHDATTVWLPSLTPPALVLEAAARYRCQVLLGGPGFLAAALREPRIPTTAGFPARVIVGGGGVDPAERSAFARRFQATVVNGYGLTETCGTNGYWATEPDGAHRWTLLAGVELAADDSLGDGWGAVRVRSPAAFSGYLGGGGPVDGWVETGDVGRIVGGALEVRGRLARMHTTPGGEKVLIDEVEAALRAVTGRPAFVGVDGGGQLVALVEGWEPEHAHAVEARLPPRARPRRLEVVAALPISPNGKVDTAACAARVREGA